MGILRAAGRAVIAGTVVLALIGGTAQLAAASPATTDPAKTLSTGTQAETSPVEAPESPRRGDDDALEISADYYAGQAVFTLDGLPDTSYDLGFGGQGDVKPGPTSSTVTTDAQGMAEIAVPLIVGDEKAGAVSVTASRETGDVTLSRSSSLWLEPTKDGLVVTGESSIAAQTAAIVADNDSAESRDVALDELFVAPADSVTQTLSASSSGEAVLRGQARWTDWNGDTHPARHITVRMMDDGYELPPVTTDDYGVYEYRFDHALTGQLQLSFEPRSDAGYVGGYFFGIAWLNYSQTTEVEGPLELGTSRTVNLTIGHDGVEQTAFAIHDALWSAYLYAQQAGGEVPLVQVAYPEGDDDSAYANSLGLHIGEWEWSAWDVIAHEYGHWFDGHHDLTSRPGGKHCFTDHLATDVCGEDDPGRGKDEGGQLAWSEGYGDYYSISAGQYAAHPSIPGVGDGVYDDLVRTSTGGILHPDPSFTVEMDGRRTEGGEDNEVAVAAVLFNLERDGHSGFAYDDGTALGPLRMTQLLEDANAERLSDFLAHMRPATGTARITPGQVEDLGCILASAEIAPFAGALQAKSYEVTIPASDVSKPPTVSWSRGNKGDFENDRFVVEISEGVSTEPFFTSATVTGTSWQPTGKQWTDIVVGHGSLVYFRVTGTQADTPTTGPFWGCATPYIFSSSAIVTSGSCAQVTLPPNDDGSTGAVNLPFPVNYFGTTYTYLYVNNNGNVTFQSPLGTFTPFRITASTPPIIAPFFADIDTRGSGSAPVTYSYGTTSFNGRQAFCVNWINVGYYSGHYDKLASAQLLLVDRSDRGAGDFDIVFNYGSIQWETGDASGGSGGFGGTPAAAGFSAGTGEEDAFFQLPGSLETRALTDGGLHALASHSNAGLATPGRYVYPVRNGNAGNSSTGVVGEVTNLGRSVAGAPLQVCPQGGGRCVFQTRTGSDGLFAAVGIPAGDYKVTAYPPAGVSGRPRTVDVTVTQNEQVDVSIELSTVVGLPSGVTISPTVGSGDVPMLNWHQETAVRFSACPGGSGTFEVLGEDGAPPVRASGTVRGVGTGLFEAAIPPLYPNVGPAQVRIHVECPSGVPRDIVFDVYIDPSGTVVDQVGQPVDGATVTLERSDEPDGPFEVVPDGSDLMSPANRANPMTTGATGAYGWDVVAGYYQLVASKDGCTTATTDVLSVPPPVLDLELVLECELPDVQAPVITVTDQQFEGNTRGGWQGEVPGVEMTDPDSRADEVSLTSDAPDVLPMGTTTVTWTATDPAGNTSTAEQMITVVDTTPPSVTCPPDLATSYTHVPDLGGPDVNDVVDPEPVVTDNRPTSWPPGTSSLTWTATDTSGNQVSCTQTVTLSLPMDLDEDQRLDSLIDGLWAAPGDTVTLDAASPDQAGAHAEVVARAYVTDADGATTDLGDVTFDATETATVAFPDSYARLGVVRIAVVFDTTELVWDTVQVGPPVPTWDPAAVYLGGDVVSYDGRRYQAQWWTQNQTPGASPWGPWAEIGITETCQAGPVQQWTSSWVYTGGETVMHNGSLWTASWWTRNQEPAASQWGPWIAAGTC